MNYDRIILELIGRVSALEDEIAECKKKGILQEFESETYSNGAEGSAGRDKTKYILDGKKYGKNRLVLAVVKKYMEKNSSTTANDLLEIFDKSLQGSLGVVRILDEVKVNCSDYKTRFFVSPDEIIKTATKDCAVCSQWGIANIGNIITRAKQLNIDITVVNR